MTACPSRVALEQYVLAPATAAARAHIESCPQCGSQVARMREEDASFRRHIMPGTIDAAVEAASASRWQWPRWPVMALPAMGLAVALLAVLLRPVEPPSDYVGSKGAGFSLEVFTEPQGGSRQAADGAELPGDARIRFSVATDRPCHLWVVSVDATGQVSRIFPASGDGGASTQTSGPVPGGGQLDGVTGPERFVAICSPEPLSWSVVEEALRRTFSPAGADSVRQTRDVRGLPTGVGQASILVEKRG
ncbi:DUF4384 domain-containing protein [Pyxidicoccus xibeiensis]|uniref:DUF4384 domain-containing protein n=1 Tax=Pyxidicoccus xibeiensis TaxID=2906759 RepID=UPI0020A7460C|nr:DUF4384 domain-containing protein [Pyxidicoccus xibeiensis]MCP3140516.1 DUF4384 domain-containing protein [Pyxidicoccus xibeiensis]